jgi:putative two-component system response regulator
VSCNKKKIIIVDDNPVNLMVGATVLQGLYEVSTVPSGEKLFKFLETIEPDLILLDIDMPGMDGFEVIKRLKAGSRTQGIPVIFLSADNSTDYEARAFALGAEDFIAKPYYPPLLRKRVELHLMAASHTKIVQEYEKTMQTLILDNKAVLDVYDALLEQKPYKKACAHEEAAHAVTQGKGTHFDPVLIDLFITVADQFRRISGQP